MERNALTGPLKTGFRRIFFSQTEQGEEHLSLVKLILFVAYLLANILAYLQFATLTNPIPQLRFGVELTDATVFEYQIPMTSYGKFAHYLGFFIILGSLFFLITQDKPLLVCVQQLRDWASQSPLHLIGAIFGGVMTPTEAASLGVFFSIVLILAYRRFTWAILRDSLLQSVKVSSMAFFILVMAAVMTHVLNTTGITVSIKEYMLDLNIGKYGILAILFVMYFFLGMFLDSWAMLFLTFSFVMPVVTAVGINPIWWGVIYVLAGDQSLVTPPYGLSLFVLHSVVPKHSIETIVRGALPFLIPLYIVIALMVIFPEIVMWLPGLLGR